MGVMEQLVSWFLIFLAGLITASAFYTIVYIAGRKSTSDELDERGMMGRKKRG
jgi:hypothetical protein